MSEKRELKLIKKKEVPVPIHEDLRRLAKSMQTVLVRRYQDAEERQKVAAQIMQKVLANA